MKKLKKKLYIFEDTIHYLLRSKGFTSNQTNLSIGSQLVDNNLEYIGEIGDLSR